MYDEPDIDATVSPVILFTATMPLTPMPSEMPAETAMATMRAFAGPGLAASAVTEKSPLPVCRMFVVSTSAFWVVFIVLMATAAPMPARSPSRPASRRRGP